MQSWTFSNRFWTRTKRYGPLARTSANRATYSGRLFANSVSSYCTTRLSTSPRLTPSSGMSVCSTSRTPAWKHLQIRNRNSSSSSAWSVTTSCLRASRSCDRSCVVCSLLRWPKVSSRMGWRGLCRSNFRRTRCEPVFWKDRSVKFRTDIPLVVREICWQSRSMSHPLPLRKEYL